MNVVEFGQTGNPAEVLKFKPVAELEPGPGEAKVNVLAAPIHPANLAQIEGAYLAPVPELPATPGMEGVGQVAALGEGVVHLSVGQSVLLTGAGGTWRDTIVAPAAAFTPAPPGDIEQLAMLAVNPLTAHLLLEDYADLQPGDWVIQSAANSAVDEMVIQLAAQRGLKTVNVVRREELILPLKALGATVVLVDGPDLAERVKQATDGADIKLALEAVSGSTFYRLIEALAYGGTLVAYGNMSGDEPQIDLRSLIADDIRLRGFWLSRWYERTSPDEKQATLGQLVPLIASGQIKTKIDSRYPLEEISEAVTRAAAGGRDGKVLLTPNHA